MIGQITAKTIAARDEIWTPSFVVYADATQVIQCDSEAMAICHHCDAAIAPGCAMRKPSCGLITPRQSGEGIPMLKKILIALAAIVVVLVAVVAMQPSEFRVTRTATISAPPADVFAQVNDFHHWQAWSPWAKLDPAAKATFEGPQAGPGAIFSWAGNDKVGEGRMTLTESRPSELIRIKLDFMKPMEGTSTTEFTFKPAGDQTAVTWTMTGHRNFVAKAVCLFMDIDKMVGGDFEKGLANLKSVAETARKT
jgi:uncharacterized protein YndB with AHSA1/START domain